MSGPNQRYHDRIAARYDDVYAEDPYWDFYHDVSWRGMKPFLPRDMSKPVLDVGCGTGLYGLRLAKSRFRVVFSDLSRKMIDVAQRKAEERFPRAGHEFVQADITDLSPFADGQFSFVVGQGDPLSFSKDWRRALGSIARVLVSRGTAVLSVDARYGGSEPLAAAGRLEELEKFLETGSGEWLADRREERFPLHAFTPSELRAGAEAAGFEVLQLFGKMVFATRRTPELYEDPHQRQRLLELEERYHATELGLGRAHHLQIALRKRT
jgi:SAM-dependent methyltransferase